MNQVKIFQHAQTKYALNPITILSDAAQHSASYLEYVSIANNTIFSSYESLDLVQQMEKSINNDLALSVYKDNIEVGFLYLYYASNTKYGILVLHTYDIDPDPIPKLLLINEVYSTAKCVTYLPKDIYTMQNISLLSPFGYRAFRYGQISTIKLQAPICDSGLLDYLNIEEV